ncbi:MAG: preprotein translocase subunit SecG [Acidobacteria bacterium ACB1]|nr:preprotein translocase subunit SecG [Acidobacteria bacterium ACB1]RIJ92434.1 MAG: preprotein translocase subunit SecG [Acidobacteriota bacterium]
MLYVLYILFFASCIVLVGAVLLQPGKTDAGALFTSNISSSALTPRGTTTILSKITIVAGVVFMVSALLISMPAFNGNVSVLSSNPEAPAEAPASTAANSNAAPAAPAAPAANTAAPESAAPAANANAAAPAANTNAAPAANK